MTATTKNRTGLRLQTIVDVLALGRYLLKFAGVEHAEKADEMIRRATIASECVRETKKLHPQYGDGSLQSLVFKSGRRTLPTEPALDDPFWCECLSTATARLALAMQKQNARIAA